MKTNLTIFAVALSMHVAFAQCPQPTGITHSNVTYYSVVINFPGFNQNSYLVEFGSPGFTPGTGAYAGGGQVEGFNTASATVNFNTSSTVQYYVRQFCTSTSSYGPNSAPGSFTPDPCPYRVQLSVGSTSTWNFCSKGIVTDYFYSCTPNHYYGNEFIGFTGTLFPGITLNATYHNNTGSSKKFIFLNDIYYVNSPCGPSGVTCVDQVSVAAGASITRRYFLSSTNATEIWFDCDDSTGCSSVQYSITNSCGTSPSSITGPPSNSVCLGSPVTLTQVGGILPPGGDYFWYEGTANGGTLMGTGSSITFTPSSSNSYYVRAEGPCGISYCLSKTINLARPVQISTSSSTVLCSPNSTVHLTASAGDAGGNTFQWLLNGNAIAGATNYYYNANLAGNWQCSAVNICGTTISNTIAITSSSYPVATITAGGSTSICTGGSVTLSAATGAGYTYQWRQNYLNVSGATNPTFVANTYTNYTCEVSNSCGTSTSNMITVTVFTGPPPATSWANTQTTFCTGGAVTLYVNTYSSGVTYSWRQNGNAIAGATSSTYLATASGIYTCSLTNPCGTTISDPITVTVNPTPPAVIAANGPLSFCTGGSVLFNANTGTGITYQWYVNSIAISGATTTTYTATTAGAYNVSETNGCGTSFSNTLVVLVSAGVTPTITPNGPVTFCTGGYVMFSATTGSGLTYQWKKNGISISGATASNYSVTTSGAYTADVTNICGTSTSNSITVTVNTVPTAIITANGPVNFCNGGSVILSANTGTGINYIWKKNNISIVGTTTSTYTATSSGAYTVSETNSCGNIISNSITVTVSAGFTATITANGPVSFCTGGSVIFSATTGTGFTYQWKKNGVSISGATASTFTATAAGAFTVDITNSCGTSSSNSMTVTIYPGAPTNPGSITGPSTFCSYQSGVVYSIAAVANATQYLWQLPQGATITAGSGTTSITVTFGNKSGNVKVASSNSCGVSAYQQKKVTRNCREVESEELVKNFTLEVMVFPNPGTGPFTLRVSGNDAGHFTFRVFDLTGRCMEYHESETGSGQIEFGNSLPAGIYMLEFITGDERKLLRFVKQD